MEVVIDGRGGWGTGASGTTLGRVLETVQSSIGRRTVIQVVLDGVELTRERQEELRHKNTNEFGLLEVKTADPVTFALEAMKGIRSHLQNLERCHGEAAQFIEAAEYGRATERLTECYSSWDTLSRAVRDVAFMIGAEMKSLDLGAMRGDDLIRRLNLALMRFRSAMEFRDVMRLSEIADQDLRPAIIAWRALLEKLAKKLPA
ncbi:MAG: hypothetical protein HYY16_05670 [Planctomycetes bacterium]|nr:hypothetical protein [Planctomycetota bacterium]